MNPLQGQGIADLWRRPPEADVKCRDVFDYPRPAAISCVTPSLSARGICYGPGPAGQPRFSLTRGGFDLSLGANRRDLEVGSV